MEKSGIREATQYLSLQSIQNILQDVNSPRQLALLFDNEAAYFSKISFTVDPHNLPLQQLICTVQQFLQKFEEEELVAVVRWGVDQARPVIKVQIHWARNILILQDIIQRELELARSGDLISCTAMQAGRSELRAMLPGLRGTTNTQLMRRGSFHDQERALDHIDHLPEHIFNDIPLGIHFERLQYLSSDLSGSETLNLRPIMSSNPPIEQQLSRPRTRSMPVRSCSAPIIRNEEEGQFAKIYQEYSAIKSKALYDYSPHHWLRQILPQLKFQKAFYQTMSAQSLVEEFEFLSFAWKMPHLMKIEKEWWKGEEEDELNLLYAHYHMVKEELKLRRSQIYKQQKQHDLEQKLKSIQKGIKEDEEARKGVDEKIQELMNRQSQIVMRLKEKEREADRLEKEIQKIDN